MVRYRTNGTLDTDFGSQGVVISDAGSGYEVYGESMAMQGDGRILVAGRRVDLGTGDTDLLLFRYEGLTVYPSALAVAMGPDINNTSLIKILDMNYTESHSFTAFDSASVRYGARVGMGDIDGDGIDEVIVSKGEEVVNNTEVKVYQVDGTPVSGANFVAFSSAYRDGARVISADFDGDGRDEIVVGASNSRPLVRIFSYDRFGGRIQDTGVIFNAFPGGSHGVNIAASDIDGDGSPELITAPASKSSDPAIALWRVDTDAGIGNWSVSPYTGTFQLPLQANMLMNATGGGAAVAAGEGMLAVGSGAVGGRVELYKGDTVYDCAIDLVDTTTRQRTGIELAIGDVDADGAEEILITLGGNPSSQTLVHVYNNDCNWQEDITPVFPGAAYGSRTAVGPTNILTY